jgi:shikimate dehydrogenase
MQSLQNLLDRVRSRRLHGLNVTIPHKQTVMQFLDELTPTAASVGAVNTICRREHKLIGDNTDAPGFLSDLKKFLTTGSRRHGELQALVLGAGGAARAVVYALLEDGWEVTIAARRREQARQLIFAEHQINITDLSLSDIELSKASLIVNATPVGMTPNMEQSPWPQNVSFPSQAAIYDLVYNPRETKMVKDACTQGLSATSGLGMLIEQAALSFEIWTGHRPPRAAILAALDPFTH